MVVFSRTVKASFLGGVSYCHHMRKQHLNRRNTMTSKRKHSKEEHPELTPYAPPQYPDVSVPEQQFDADEPGEKEKVKKPPARPK